MKVLVTGGAGFIGSHVVDGCLAEGHSVAVLDDLSTGKRANVNPLARLHVADLCDQAAVERIVAAEQPEVICHLAAKANVRESMVEPVLYAQVNIIGSLSVLEAARKIGVRKVVYASTGGAVYGEPEYLPVDEQHPIKPVDPYGASKHHVEHYLHIYGLHFGVDYTILRYPNVYGPRQDPFGEAGVIAIWTERMLHGKEAVINGSGDQERDFCYVGDVARGNVLALTRGSREIYNLGTGVGSSINRVYTLLREYTGYTGPEVHGPAKQGEVWRTWLKVDKAREGLGWSALVPLEEGLKRTVESFR
ncbi:MAG: NAD-dependent epimerase/dehydratase family protein [Chloroflexi bacterium]|nr:NAD-dependent epimerase/dehydratase family protein [Chloroflexota bacterium]